MTDYIIAPLTELFCIDTLATIAALSLVIACVPVLQIALGG